MDEGLKLNIHDMSPPNECRFVTVRDFKPITCVNIEIFVDDKFCVFVGGVNLRKLLNLYAYITMVTPTLHEN